jgi:2,4-dienoyl-CoA reductase-like NADH-dependent reductase (Old Yellow Enzyme family)
MLQVVRMLEKAGIDAVELSGGMLYSGKLSPVRQGKLASEDKEVYYQEAAGRYKQSAGVPLMLVGGIRSYGVAERLVSEGLADYVSLSRPLICEPALIRRWQSGDTSKAKCQSDNLCFTPAIQGEGIYCVVEKRLRDKENS